jgi:hypothetical protein
MGQVGKLQLAEQAIVFDHQVFPLEDTNEHAGLGMRGKYEVSGPEYGNNAVATDDDSHGAPKRLNPQCERTDVLDEKVMCVYMIVCKNSGLDGSARHHSLVAVNSFNRLLAKVLCQQLMDLRNLS